MRAAVIMVSAFLLSGCMTMYAPDLSNGAARVRVVVDYPENTYVRVLKEACYVNTDSGEHVAVLPNPTLTEPVRHSIGMMPLSILRPKTRFKEFGVPAGAPLNLAIHAQGVYGGGCRNAVSFIPVAGEDYEFLSEQSREGCVIRARRLTQSGPEPIPVRQVPQCKVF